TLFYLLFLLANTAANAQSTTGLLVVDQDYQAALRLAKQEQKLVFVDFYTDWCGPCKQLDKYVFADDSLGNVLGEHVVLLKYNAEKDSAFHLTKKYHVNSYPTGMVLSQDGKVVARQSGFSGEDRRSLGASVFSFVVRADSLNTAGDYASGYSTTIDPDVYPDFYVDYIDDEDADVDLAEINAFLLNADDPYGEAYFATLMYFAMEASDSVASKVLDNRKEYAQRYGVDQLDVLTKSLVMGKFDRAVEQQNQTAFDEAVRLARKHLPKEFVDFVLPQFEMRWLEAQGKWGEIFNRYEAMKADGKMSNGYINHVSWGAYVNCDDEQVLRKFSGWMKEIVTEKPKFDYLDTYAFLLYKSGNKAEAKTVAERAIMVGEAEDRSVTELRELLGKL
ncbi:MAG: thioredoxin family protein, partial [Bacteroidota bacterium]